MDVSIIIVNYNTKALLKDCINSILQHTFGIDYEVIVIDNASVDDTQKMIEEDFDWVKLIANEKNLGFGTANNQGAEIAKGEYLFFLNSDCVLLNNAVKIFYDFMEKQNHDGSIGAVGGVLLDKNLKMNSSFQKFPKIYDMLYDSFGSYFVGILKPSEKKSNRMNYATVKEPYLEVGFVVGADIFIPTGLFKQFNGFDETFFLYFEETDLQKRMANEGYKRVVINGPEIIHLIGSSTDSSKKSLKTTILFKDSMYKYFKKHYSRFNYIVFYLLITPILALQILQIRLSHKDRKEFLKMLLRKL